MHTACPSNLILGMNKNYDLSRYLIFADFNLRSNYLSHTLFPDTIIVPLRWSAMFFYLFYHGWTAVAGPVLLLEASRSHSDTPHSVGLLWTNDQTSTWQHKRLTRDIHAPGVIRTRNPGKRAAADLHLRPRGHRDRQVVSLTLHKGWTSKVQWMGHVEAMMLRKQICRVWFGNCTCSSESVQLALRTQVSKYSPSECTNCVC